MTNLCANCNVRGETAKVVRRPTDGPRMSPVCIYSRPDVSPATPPPLFRYIVDFQFIKDFLEGTVAQSYTVAWKRDAFFKFVELYQDPTTSQQLKAKVGPVGPARGGMVEQPV